MKKIVILAMMLIGIVLGSCTSEDDAKSVEGQMGSIYGIVTELGTSEPMKSIGVELYKSEKLLLKTVTFDDGHFEFVNLVQGDYQVNVVSDEYEQTEKGLVTIEAGRQARIDLQVRKLTFKKHIVVRTIEPVMSGSKVTLSADYTYEEGDDYKPSEVGFVYDTNGNPKEGGTVIKCKVNNETKSFSTTVDDFGKGTYYVQAYAKNRLGTEYGELRSFNLSGTTVVVTLSPTGVSASGATLNGRIESIGNPAFVEKGFCYNKSGEPTVSDIKVVVSGVKSGDYTYTCVGLSPNTTYFVRAYAIQNEKVMYGTSFSFSTDMTATSVSTSGATNVTATSATLNGLITNVGSPAYTEKGFCYATMPNPTISNIKKVVEGTTGGNYTADINNLSYNTTYYYRAYAIQNGKPVYGPEVSFSTGYTEAVVYTSGATNVTPSSATLNGSIANAGSPTYTEKGFCYSTFSNPTINSQKKVVSGTGEGNFSTSISGLSYNTTYYYRAYVIQNGNPVYGSVVSFSSGFTEAIVETYSTVKDITYNSAKLGFTVKNAGDPLGTEVGVCYGVSSNPTINSNKVSGNINTKLLQAAIVSGLLENTTYYFRAYIMQQGNAVYGTTYSFKTATRPSVSTLSVSNLQNQYGLMNMWQVQLNGRVNSVGNPAINGRGFKYSTNGDPESGGTIVSASGSSTGNYSASLSQLKSNTTYYIRAYVKNSLGYEYGDLVTFTTGD